MHLVSSYCSKNVSDENVKRAGLNSFFTYKPNESTLQALHLQAYFSSPYFSGLMRVSHCFSYLNNITEFQEFFLQRRLHRSSDLHPYNQAQDQPAVLSQETRISIPTSGRTYCKASKDLAMIDVHVLCPLHANHTRTESQLLQTIVASRFHLSYTLVTS